MGDRTTIIIKSEQFETPISLYGHWGGKSARTAVAEVLNRTDRIGDPSYLTAQIFYEYAVSLNGYNGTLSFGISAWKMSNDDIAELTFFDDNNPVIVNADTGEVEYEGETFTADDFATRYKLRT